MPEITVFGGYVVAAALLTGPTRANPTGLAARLAPILALLTVLAHGWLLWRVAGAHVSDSLSLANTLSLSGWLLAVLVLAYTVRPGFQSLAALFLVAAGIAVLFTQTVVMTGPANDTPVWQFVSHVVMATLAYNLMAVAAALAVLMALKDKRIRRSGTAGWTAALPPLESMERHMFGAIVVGFALLSLAIFSGLVFVRDLMSQHLAHKTVLTSLAWLTFGVLLAGRWRFGWRGRTAANWTLSGFAILALAYFGSRMVLELILGRHWG